MQIKTTMRYHTHKNNNNNEKAEEYYTNEGTN